MSQVIWLASLAGLMSTAVIFGTDAFFLTVGRPALRSAAEPAATEVMGYIHFFGDSRMPIWGSLAILSNFLLVLFSRSGHRAFYLLSLSVLLLFVVVYDLYQSQSIRFKQKPPRPEEDWTMLVGCRHLGTVP
jgi:hypothetical protein